LAVLYRTGLRCAEALALELRDLELDQGYLRVRHGKGDRARVVGLDPGAVGTLEVWLRKRGNPGTPLLFSTWTGRPLQTSHVRRLLKVLGRKAGIAKRVHPHGLRHTHAAELATEGIPMTLIQKQLGHASLAVTSRYLDHIAPTQLIETMKARTWR
jgi:integrase